MVFLLTGGRQGPRSVTQREVPGVIRARVAHDDAGSCAMRKAQVIGLCVPACVRGRRAREGGT